MRKRGTKSSTSTSSVASASAPHKTPSSSSPSTSAPKKGKQKGKQKGTESGRSGSRTTGRGGSSSHKQGGSAGTPTNSGTCATHTVPIIKKGFLFFSNLIPPAGCVVCFHHVSIRCPPAVLRYMCIQLATCSPKTTTAPARSNQFPPSNWPPAQPAHVLDRCLAIRILLLASCFTPCLCDSLHVPLRARAPAAPDRP